MDSFRQTLSAAAATALDKELMSTGAFSIDQLMELAGLSVSQVIYRVHPPAKGNRVLVACGPGNNGEPLGLYPLAAVPGLLSGASGSLGLKNRGRRPRGGPPPQTLRLPADRLLPEAQQERAVPGMSRASFPVCDIF